NCGIGYFSILRRVHSGGGAKSLLLVARPSTLFLRVRTLGDHMGKNVGRVLMLVENNSYPRDTRVRGEAEALRVAGYQISVISPSAKGQAWHELVNGVRVYRFPAPFEAHGFLGYLWEYTYATLAIFLLSL